VANIIASHAIARGSIPRIRIFLRFGIPSHPSIIRSFKTRPAGRQPRHLGITSFPSSLLLFCSSSRSPPASLAVVGRVLNVIVFDEWFYFRPCSPSVPHAYGSSVENRHLPTEPDRPTDKDLASKVTGVQWQRGSFPSGSHSRGMLAEYLPWLLGN
jgi:hypothetical protein